MLGMIYDYESLFPFVKKPSRYMGGEWNTVTRNEIERKKNSVSVCFVFPDLYDVGVANTGLEILYHIVNRREDAFAERSFCPDTDITSLLRERSWPLFSLESRNSLSSFDILGFGLPYELCYANILEVLSLSKIPFRSSERTEQHPLIIGGGPCAVNPEPIADFFDAIVLGDGEEIIGEIVVKVKAHKKSGAGRKALLESLLEIKGLYLPSFYEVTYLEDGRVQAIRPTSPLAPSKIAYRQVEIHGNGNGSLGNRAPIVPYLQTVQDRVNVEIQRGCPWRCRFCQIGFSSHAYRERRKDEILQIVEEGLKNTGYDSVTVSGLSAADHSEIETLFESLANKFTSQRISFGLPSTRADRFSVALANKLQLVRRASLTFAPEAGTERLRRVVRKELSESEIRETLRLAYQGGWKNVKLYFMYGLPTETESDLDGIVQLVKVSKRENPGLSLTITLSPFVPKPHTPFQWLPQASLSEIQNKLAQLRKNLPAAVRAHGLKQIILEGVLARGDRRLCGLIQRAWELGARLDGWTEHFHPQIWESAFLDIGLDPDFYAHRSREESEIFPWDHLEGGPEKGALWKDLQAALRLAAESPIIVKSDHYFRHSGETCPDLSGSRNLVKQTPSLDSDYRRSNAQNAIEPTVQKLRVRLARFGAARFLSHLEQIEMFRKLLRRSGLPVNYSHGFHPQIRCSFGPAISVGYESASEYFDVELTRRVNLEEAKEKIIKQLPDGFSLMKIGSVPVSFPSLESLVSKADYEVELPPDIEKSKDKEDWESILQESLKEADQILSVIRGEGSKQRVKEVSLRNCLVRAQWSEKSERPLRLELSLKMGPGKNVKPEVVVSHLLGLKGTDLRIFKVKRCRLYVETADGDWIEP